VTRGAERAGAAFIQELSDLVFLGGVVTIAPGRINPR
jgi:hypothetical protein